MKVLQRYRFDEYYNEGAGVVPDDNGEFVRFDDVMRGGFIESNSQCVKCPNCGKELIINITSS